MDKKFTIAGLLLIVIAILLAVQANNQQKLYAQYKKDHPELFAQPAAPAGTATAISPAAAEGSGTSAAAPVNPVMAAPAPAKDGTLAWLTPAAPVDAYAHFATRELSNNAIDVTLTENGGAIETVTLKKHAAQYGSKDPLVFNANAPVPALAILVADPTRANESTYWSWTGSKALAVTGSVEVPPVPLLGLCKVDTALSNDTSVTFRGTTVDGLEVTRTYSLSSGNEDAYLIHTTTTIANHGANTMPLTRIFVNAGMAPPPAREASSISKSYLDFAYFDGVSAKFITAMEFQAKPPFLGLIGGGPKQTNYVYAERTPLADLQWVSVKDQFFTTVLMPKGVLGSGFYVNGVELSNAGDTETTISGDLELNLGTLAPGAETKLEMSYYVGPKEYVSLDRMGDHQDLIMQFGMFGGFSKILLLALIAIHGAIASLSPSWAWGWSIILFTVIIKGMTWPLTAIQVRSGKRMRLIQGPMKELREKYKDNPQKMNTEMFALYKKYKINPAAGCLPMLIIFPIFLAFISVMRTSSEMRFQPFLWMHDLSMPDTIGHVTLPYIGAFAINLMPLLMTATMMIQMHLMPAPSADATQQNIMKFMPLLFLAGFYTMPSGMILYYTCSNLFTIFQQYLTNRSKDDIVLEPVPAAGSPKSKRR